MAKKDDKKFVVSKNYTFPRKMWNRLLEDYERKEYLQLMDFAARHNISMDALLEEVKKDLGKPYGR